VGSRTPRLVVVAESAETLLPDGKLVDDPLNERTRDGWGIFRRRTYDNGQLFRRRRDAIERLIIAAAPTALGDLRPALTPAVREVVIAELPKDLTNLPTPQLEKHFAELLPL